MRKLLLLLSMCMAIIQLSAQTRTVTGRVTDQAGNPVPGASVQVKGTTSGTITSANGTYSLRVPQNSRTLTISSLNFGSQDVSIGNQSAVNVQLQATAAETLEQVVVTGYGLPQRRRNSTASVTSVAGKELENKPVASVDQLLAGKVPGLLATNTTGQPGADLNIRIRGIGSISASSQPLYVVDGVILNSGNIARLAVTSNTLAGINPNDIEDVTVLKDASATALYGSRGANGVILITTKGGRAGKTRFRADAEVGNSNYADAPPDARFLNADEWLTLFEEGYRNAGYTQAQIDPILASYGKGSGVNTDWKSLVTRTGKQQQYNLSASGGEGKTTFYISGGYFDQQASVIASEFKRYSVTANFKHTVSKKINFGLNLSGNNNIQYTPSNGGAFANPVGGTAFLFPTQNPYNADGSLNINRSGPLGFVTYNPLYIAQNDIHKLNAIQFRGVFNGEYIIIPQVKLSTRYGIDYDAFNEYTYWNPFHGDGRTTSGRGQASDTRAFNWISTTQLSYSGFLESGKHLKLDATVGYEAQKSKTEALDASATTFPPTTQLYYSTNAATVLNGKLSESDFAFNSIISLASLNYRGKYVLTGSFRRDASSRFSDSVRHGNFWSVGASWNVDQEDFFSPFRAVVNSFRLRASYGTTGNASGINNYGYRQLVGFGGNYNGLPGGTFNTVGNPLLTWEKQKQFDIGADLGFLKNRIGLTADYYKRVSSDMIFADPLSLTTGFASITRNIGTMQNTGFELALRASPISTPDFKWDVNFNISFNKNKITKLPGGKDIIDGSFILREGLDYRTYFARVYVGVDPATGDPLWYKDSTHTSTVTNRNLATREPLTGMSASPKYFGGLSTSFTYKGFSLGADFIYNYGNYVTDGWIFYLADGVDVLEGKYASNLRRWQKPGDITDVPRYVYSSTNNSSSFSTRFLYKGDYVRLRNLTLGYSVQEKWLKRAGLTSANLYVRGTNLWTKTYDKHLTVDPEAGVNGSSNLDVYYTKTVTFGLNLGF